MKNSVRTLPSVAASFAVLLLAACAEKGASGEEGLDCGVHGSAHGEHCHCNDGYFFDGATCVDPEQIAEPCEAAGEADAGEGDSDGAVEAAHHHDAACVCPVEGECPCEGEISTFGGVDYCRPLLHEE